MSMDEYRLYERESPDLDGIEADLYDTIDTEEPWNLVEKFSELERVSGSDDEKKAAEYITSRLDALGIPFNRYDPSLYLSIPHDATLEKVKPATETFESAKTVSFSSSSSVTGEVVYIEMPEAETMEDVLSADVDLDAVDASLENKIVLLPTMSLSIETVVALEEAGAAGFVGIHPHPEEPHEGIATPIWGGAPSPDEVNRIPDLPIIYVSKTDGERLIESAKTDDLELSMETNLTQGWFNCPLVLSRIPGEADPDNNDFVLLHGHYDSWFTGVTDNATGDAGLLELARVFNEYRNQLKRDLWVAWWPGHSTGRYAGSTWFADEFATKLYEDCVAHVNMDSPGTEDATEFEDMVMWMPEADELCKTAIDDVAGKNGNGTRPARAGDYSFNNIGISGFFMLSSNIPKEVREERGYHPVGGCGGNSNAWHLSTDTLDKADPDVLVRDIRVYATAVVRVLNADVLPLDHRTTIATHQEYIMEYEEAAGAEFDFSPVVEELSELSEVVEDLYTRVESGNIENTNANEAIKRLSRALVHVSFASEDYFDQDPAINRPPYPALASATELSECESDEYGFQQVALKRARNKVVQTLRDVRKDVELLLD